MKIETLIFICGGLFLVMMTISIFDHPAVQNASAEMLHEFKTADFWQSAAYTAPVGNNLQGTNPMAQQPMMTQPMAMKQQGILTQQGMLTQVAFPYPNGIQGTYPQYQVQPQMPKILFNR